MTPLVTLEEAKQFCHVRTDYQDATFRTLIGAASAAVRDHADGWVHVEGEPVPDRIKLAVLAHVAKAFDNPEVVDLPFSAARLLNPLRKLDL